MAAPTVSAMARNQGGPHMAEQQRLTVMQLATLEAAARAKGDDAEADELQRQRWELAMSSYERRSERYRQHQRARRRSRNEKRL